MIKQGVEHFLHYKGPILYDTIGQLISDLKERMFEARIKQAVYKKVLMVMIEALENVFKYHEYFEKDKVLRKNFPPEITIDKDKSCFRITCSNPVLKKDSNELKKRLDYINSLDRAGVKEEYKNIITNGQFSEKGGAGLGLIEMAKISDSILGYKLDPINDKFEYYSLNLIINYG
ncbi:MAG: SiaB family protein kinase [Bacteroidales bacterium]|nr:SiaB family protein kinase [Bacteroidales bacterium]MBN2817583.1 SiaB family protein kinase [Bacteroidales bacterium]